MYTESMSNGEGANMNDSTNWSASKKLAVGRKYIAKEGNNSVRARYHLMGAAYRMGANRDEIRMMSPLALLDLIADIKGN